MHSRAVYEAIGLYYHLDQLVAEQPWNEDTEECEALRDRLDELWREFTHEEISVVTQHWLNVAKLSDDKVVNFDQNRYIFQNENFRTENLRDFLSGIILGLDNSCEMVWQNKDSDSAKGFFFGCKLINNYRASQSQTLKGLAGKLI